MPVSRFADSNFSEPMSLFVDAILSCVDLVDGLGRRVGNIVAQGGLPDRHVLFVDQA